MTDDVSGGGAGGDNGAGGGGAAPILSGGGNGGDGGGSFLDSITNPDLRAVAEKKGWDSLEKALGSYVSLERTFYADRDKGGVRFPDENSTPEERREFFGKLGVPETPDGYKFEAPEGFDGYDADTAKEFAKIAHDANLPPDAAKALHDWYVGRVAEGGKQAAEKAAEKAAKYEAGLTKLLGQARGEKAAQIGEAARFVFGEEGVNWLIEQGEGNNPVLAEAMLKVYPLIASDDGNAMAARGAAGTLTPSEAQGEIERLMGDLKSPYWDSKHPNHKSTVQRVRRLYQMATPDNKVVVSEGTRVRV
jgi:hypothetical protein